MSHPFDEAELHDLAAALAQSDDAVRDTIGANSPTACRAPVYEPDRHWFQCDPKS